MLPFPCSSVLSVSLFLCLLFPCCSVPTLPLLRCLLFPYSSVPTVPVFLLFLCSYVPTVEVYLCSYLSLCLPGPYLEVFPTGANSAHLHRGLLYTMCIQISYQYSSKKKIFSVPGSGNCSPYPPPGFV